MLENTESTKRQYSLRDRAVSLGWPIERIHVIDCDLGLSGASAEDRDGFQRLKERALEKTTPINGYPGRYRPDDDLMAFLKGL